MTWGNDDPKLTLLGFVPSSEIWTEGAPPAPKDLAYDAGTGTFSWDAVNIAESYNIYHSVVPMGQPSGSYSNIGSTPSNAYDDTAVSPGMTHYYYVTALNSAEESDPSGVVNVDVQ